MKKTGTAMAAERQFHVREDAYKELVRKLEYERRRTEKGGGEKALQKMREKGKLPARERIARLIDVGSSFIELNTFAAHGMYEEWGGAPGAGTVMGIGRVSGRDCVIVANDSTVKAGAWFPMTCKKNLRAQEIAMENRLPIIYLVDSAGVFLPLQDEIFPDREHFGRIFRNNARMSAMGIPQIAAIMGPCVAGGAYLPIMSDEALIVKGEGSVFLAGAHLVKAAIGEVTDNESLGGAEIQSNVSGVTDYVMESDEECLAEIRSLIDKFGERGRAGFSHVEARLPLHDVKEVYGVLPDEAIKQYDMYELISRIVDGSEIDEYKGGYGKSLITAYARIDGWAVGIVANQRKVVKSARGEMQVGGVIYSDSADKAARFIMNCNQRRIPLLFLQDVTGFMVGTKAEHGGIIKDGAKLVNAVANSVVPKITIIVGNSYGAGNYAMCGKAYDPRFIFAYPAARISVMGGSQAANVLTDIRVKQLEKSGKVLGEEERLRMADEVRESYEAKSTPLYAAARLWVDEVIDPARTREYVSRCIEVADCNPEVEEFKVGVMQV